VLIAGHEKGQGWVRFLHSARLGGNLLTLGQIRHPTLKKNDYYPLIARAVERLDRSTGESRRAVYERARKAVAQLHSNQPALLDADITKERIALEEAIRKVEAEAARKSPPETWAEPRSAAPSEGMPDSDKIQSRDHGQPASSDRDDRPPALPSRQAPIFLPTAFGDRHNADIQAVAIGGAYGADHYHDDIPGSRWRGGLLVVMAVLALAVLAGTFAYRVMLGGYVFPALPPIVIAGTEPNNIVRNNSDTRRNNSSKTSVTRAGWSEKLQPIDIREAPKTVPRVISTIPISSTLSTGPVAPGPAATAPALDPPVASALDQHIAPSVPPLASDPVPVPASSKLNETAAVAPVAREPGAPSLAVALPVSAASVPPPSAPVPVPTSSEPHETAAVAPAAPMPALAPPVSTASVPPPSAPVPIPTSSEPSETAVGAPAPTPALAPPVLTAASVPPPASAPLPVPASSELNETAAVAPVARGPGAPSPAVVPPLLTVASVPPPASAPSEPKEIHRVIVGPDGWGETDTSRPPALADAQGDAAPPLVLLCRRVAGPLWRCPPAAPTRFRCPPNAVPPRPARPFGRSGPNSRTSSAGASRWCAALISGHARKPPTDLVTGGGLPKRAR
jgi:hypothetical protein